MASPHEYRLSLEQSEHLRTLAAMMQQDGVDVAFASAETHGGIPFTTILVQGPFADSAVDVAEALARKVEELRSAAKGEAGAG